MLRELLTLHDYLSAIGTARFTSLMSDIRLFFAAKDMQERQIAVRAAIAATARAKKTPMMGLSLTPRALPSGRHVTTGLKRKRQSTLCFRK
jgi:hypothetical protein